MKNRITLFLAVSFLIIGTGAKASTCTEVTISLNSDTSKNTASNNDKKYKKIDQNKAGDNPADYISADDISLHANHGVMKLSNINTVTAKAVYGNPVSQKNEFSEVDDANVLTFNYKGGNISFINGTLSNIESLSKSFVLELKKTKGSTLLIKPGSDVNYLKNNFPLSWKNGKTLAMSKGVNGSFITVFIKTSNGIKTDAFITFFLTEHINNNANKYNTISKIYIDN